MPFQVGGSKRVSGVRPPLAYESSRSAVAKMVPVSAGPILDIGCSTGELGSTIKASMGSDVQVWGIEIDEVAADAARTRLDRVFVGDAQEQLEMMLAEGLRPGVVIFADSLEHMIDPWHVFDLASRLISQNGGYIVVSLPNVAFWDTLWHLLRGIWPYRDRGIHDSTHLRFFAKKNVEALLQRSGVCSVRITRLYRLIDRPHVINRFGWMIGWIWPNLFTYQYLGIARVDVMSS